MSYEKLDRVYPFVYSIDNKAISRVSFIEDLGVTFDSRLKFDKHIEKITAKAFKSIGFINQRTVTPKNLGKSIL